MLRSVEEIEAEKDALAPFQQHPHADVDLYLTRFSNPEDDSRPCVVVVSRNGQVQGMVLAMIHTVALELRVGYKALCSPRVRMMSVAPGAVQGNLEGGAAEALVEELLALLRRREADAVRMADLDADSGLAMLARKLPSLLCRDYAPWSGPHYGMTLPESIDAFYRQMKEKHRRPLRKACRLLEEDKEDDSDTLRYRLFTHPGEVDQFAAAAEAIAQQSYQRHLGSSYVDSPSMRHWLRALAERGQWRGYVLYADQRPCAYWVGWLYGKTFYVYYAGRDPSCRDFNPGTGTILFAKMIEDLCEHTAARVADFGPGDYPYKRRFCDISKQTVTLLIFGPTPFGMGFNMARTVLSWAEKGAKAVLGRLGFLDRIKRFWRNRLAGTTSD